MPNQVHISKVRQFLRYAQKLTHKREISTLLP